MKPNITRHFTGFKGDLRLRLVESVKSASAGADIMSVPFSRSRPI